MSEDRPRSLGGLSDELGPYIDRHEAEPIDRFGEHLEATRPFARPAFRSELRAQLSELQRKSPWRPRRLALTSLAYVGAGLSLMVIAAVGLAGIGPFAV